ncbi:MAG: Wzz/FepE/Etk N-terminal domain-containing protein [Pseudomonadota bacterium]
MSDDAQETLSASDELMQSLMPLLIVLAESIRFLLGVPLLAGVAAVVYSVLSEPIYTATGRILPPQYNENTVMAMTNQMGGESQLGNSALMLKNPNDLFVGILTSRTIVDSVVHAHDLQEYYEMPLLGDARKQLAGATDIRASKNGIVSISVEDTSREMAATLANAYVDQFYAFSEKLARSQAARRSAFYARSLDDAKRQLLLADQALAEVKKTTGFTGLQGQEQAIVLAAAEVQAQIAARQTQLKTMAAYATPSNPDVRLIKREIANLKVELESLSAFQKVTDADGDPLPTLSDTPDAFMIYSQRKRDVEYWENVVDLIGRFSELGKIDESRDMSLFQVLDEAIPPEDKSKPRTKVNAILAVVASGFLCLLWVLAGAYIRQRMSRSSAFSSQFMELRDVLMRQLLFRRSS